MFKNVCDVIVVIVSVIMEIEIFRNLIIIRDNKCDESGGKISLRKARVLIVGIIILYSIYGIVRNII